MSTFVLVHGAWHDGSAWEPVVKYLEAQGHQAFAPTIAEDLVLLANPRLAMTTTPLQQI